jgi:two-component system LytT family sensor kinase
VIGVDGTGAAVGVLLALAGLGGVAVAFVTWSARRHRDLGTPAERATFATLHTASLAAPPLREGLTPTGARRSARHLRALLGTPAIALTDVSTMLAWDGAGDHHAQRAVEHAAGRRCSASGTWPATTSTARSGRRSSRR